MKHAASKHDSVLFSVKRGGDRYSPRHAAPSRGAGRGVMTGVAAGHGGATHARSAGVDARSMLLYRPFAVLAVGALVACAGASTTIADADSVSGADDSLAGSTVAASRNYSRTSLLTETVNTDNEGEWTLGAGEDGLGEALSADADAQTKKLDEEKAEKEAEEQAAKEKAEAEAKAEAEKKAAEEAAAATGTDSADTSSDSTNSSADTGSSAGSSTVKTTGTASSKYGQKIADGALALVGGHMDCTMLATLALKAGTGIYFHGWPEDYRNFPGAVEVSLSEAEPGDILVYRDGTSYDMNGPGHADHVAIYIGGGKAVHGGWNGSNVAVANVKTVSGIPEHVYRVM